MPKKQPVLVLKATNRTLIYRLASDPTPLFFDLTNGKGDLLPTVFTLWKYPSMCPGLTTTSGVSKRLLRGADLMLPGVYRPVGGWSGEMLRALKKQTTFVVWVRGNPMPVAVGTLLVDAQHIAEYGMRGRAIKVRHCYRDCLWEIGNGDVSMASSIAPPNDGFGVDVVMPVGNEDVEDWTELLDEYDEEYDGDEEEAGEEEEGEEDGQEKEDGQEQEDAEENDDEEEEEVEEPVAEERASREDVDAALMWAFLFVVKTRVSEDMLPLPASQLFSEHMRSVHRAPFALDVKHSSYKKLSKFIKSLDKAGIINTKQTRQGPVITAVNQWHDEVSSFEVSEAEIRDVEKHERRVARQRKAALEQRLQDQADEDDAGGSVSTALSSSAASDAAKNCRIVYLYKPDSRLRASFFPDFGSNDLVDLNEAKRALWAYVASEELEVDGGRNVLVDDTLAHALFITKEQKKQQKRASRSGARGMLDLPEKASKRELAKLFDGHMKAYYVVLRGPEVEQSVEELDPKRFKLGPVPSVTITTEKRQGRKMVTLVSGLEVFSANPDDVARACQKKFASSASVTTTGGGKKKATSVIVIQGDVSQDLAPMLKQQYGIPPALIQVQAGGTRKGRKRGKRRG